MMDRCAKVAVAAAVLTVVCSAAPVISAVAAPDFGLALRAGAPGAGLDLDLGLSPSFGMRVGFGGFRISHDINTLVSRPAVAAA